MPATEHRGGLNNRINCVRPDQSGKTIIMTTAWCRRTLAAATPLDNGRKETAAKTDST